eukprot:CAMPEP_0197856836 /NCGR_PEP_ID=MMETSP1438-20131217/29327_1 /TAXON_ID=1461541 /ORGANISM="Pterosperma sp., Strain CCMP1384" /LENGTH=121 /DNA_ID=CAMNT_0043472429 /DNA_START=104 /DNA_END=469 /DNA_ORIENTATION=-
MAEAMKKAEEEEDVEKQVQAALDCPCVADLKEGVCGPNFIEAFSCFIRSTEEEKGSDCLPAFQGLQMCMFNNADHFSDFFTGGDDDDDTDEDGEDTEEGTQEGKDEEQKGQSSKKKASNSN